MFFLRYLEREIDLHPSFLGSNITNYLQERLYDDMEGSCNGEYYIICIMDINNISAGRVVPGAGVAQFTILYRAILWKPFKGEAVDCVVESVKAQGVFAAAGPLSIFVSKMHLVPGMKYNPDTMPVQFTEPITGDAISKGSAIRVQLIGVREEAKGLYGVGKMSNEWFGLIQD